MFKNNKKIIVIMFIFFIISINIFYIITPDRNFSEFENRMLSQLPKFKIKYIINGSFAKKIEEYITDQFPFRDYWVGVKSDIERLTLKTSNNGIYFAKDGFLLEEYNKPGKILNKNIKDINKFWDNSKLLTHVLIVPNSIKIYDDKLPLFASPYNQIETIEIIKKELNKKINFIDIYDSLKERKTEYIYFKTDHHWTMRGAYYGYKILGEKLGIKSYNLNDFKVEKVTDKFYGTFYSRANNKHITPDYIEIFEPKFNIDYEVYYKDEDKYTNSLYQLGHLNKKDKYSVFLDGNHSLVTIKTNIKNNKRLVIFKDSYAHSFIPFLANHYEEIHIIDLRYYRLDVYEYIKDNKINEALFLYNVQTFSNNDSIISF